MKRRNGFTLIELLAVIVILAIIALIAVPIILNVIEKSKESSAVDSAYGYIHAIEEGVVESEVKNGLLAENTEYTDLASFESTYGITVKGNKPTSGLFRLEKRQVVYAEFAIDGYSIVCDKKKCESKGKGELITLTYNLDGGSLSKSEDRLVKGSSISLPVPTKEHYGFDGWYTEGNERVNNETIFNENVTLTAHWTKNRYTVTFDAGENATASESSLSVDSGDTLNLPSASKEGYTFNGWFTEVNGGSEVTNSTPILSSQTLYAHYTINTYTITYNSNGGSEVSPSSVTVQYGQTLTLPETTKENYILAGWFTASENGDEITSSTPITSSMTLYAHYISAIQNFDYTGNAQEVTLQPGRYKLEVWGAQGGYYSNEILAGGMGGYSYGEITLNEVKTLYVVVGSKGETSTYTSAGGYNGGGATTNSYGTHTAIFNVSGGGGATHIALRTGLLSTLEQYKSDVLIVAGGGGGQAYRDGGGGSGGSAGGISGGRGLACYACGSSTNSYAGTAGTQNSGYAFGLGASDTVFTSSTCGGGGGGGWYGGNVQSQAACNGPGGAGGSGYIGNSLLTNKGMYCYTGNNADGRNSDWTKCNTSNDESTYTIGTTNYGSHIENYANTGNGYARITYLGKN